MRSDVELDYIADSIHAEYLRAFTTLWGLPEYVARKTGVLGNDLFEAEFKAHGPAAYNTSVVMPIRNAHFNNWSIGKRHKRLFEHEQYPLPLLDYGCGVGFQLMWLKAIGYPPQELWGYDLPGPQETVAKHVLGQNGINFGIPDKPATIFCFHVLEHLEDPFTLIDKLRSMGGKLYASCIGCEGHGHLVDKAKTEEVISYLRDNDEFVEDHWSDE